MRLVSSAYSTNLAFLAIAVGKCHIHFLYFEYITQFYFHHTFLQWENHTLIKIVLFFHCNLK